MARRPRGGMELGAFRSLHDAAGRHGQVMPADQRRTRRRRIVCSAISAVSVLIVGINCRAPALETPLSVSLPNLSGASESVTAQLRDGYASLTQTIQRHGATA